MDTRLTQLIRIIIYIVTFGFPCFLAGRASAKEFSVTDANQTAI
jgi:hypothetical protein